VSCRGVAKKTNATCEKLFSSFPSTHFTHARAREREREKRANERKKEAFKMMSPLAAKLSATRGFVFVGGERKNARAKVRGSASQSSSSWEGKNTSSSSSSSSSSPEEEREEEEEEEETRSREESESGLEKAGFVNEERALVKVVVDRVVRIEEQEDFSYDWAPVVLRALDGSDRVIPVFSGNKENSILSVLFNEVKKRKKHGKESDETITFHSWEGRIHAGFENAEAVVVCERGVGTTPLELDEDEINGENLRSMFETILKEAVERSGVDWESLAKWQAIAREEETSSSRNEKSRFSIKIVDSNGAINMRDWQVLRSILRKEILTRSRKTYDLPNDSEVLLSLLVALVKNLPIYVSPEVLQKYSMSYEWGMTYRRGHSAPIPKWKQRIIFKDDGIDEESYYDGYKPWYIEVFKTYDKATKFSADGKNSPMKKRKNGPMYRRELDQLILKRLEVALFIRGRFIKDGKLEDDGLMALYQHPRLKKLADEINEILPVEKRCGAAKKIIDLEVAVQREDYQAAAELREDLRKLNNITWIYLRGNQVNPFDD
jgi:hypothetical protein